MSKTITLNLSGMMAAYGTGMRLQYRFTESTPTESGVLGLIRCALGIPRGEDWPEQSELSLRVTSAGHESEYTDFQTIRNAITYDGSGGRSAITRREYLIGSSAHVEVSGPDELIDRVTDALRCPHWQLYLGRRCCVPSTPILVPTQ